MATKLRNDCTGPTSLHLTAKKTYTPDRLGRSTFDKLNHDHVLAQTFLQPPNSSCCKLDSSPTPCTVASWSPALFFVCEPFTSSLLDSKTGFYLVVLSRSFSVFSFSTSGSNRLYSHNADSNASSSLASLSCNYLFAALYSFEIANTLFFSSVNWENNSSSSVILNALPPLLSVLPT